MLSDARRLKENKMPRLDDAKIFARIQQAMQPVTQLNTQPTNKGAVSQTMEQLLQQAKAKRNVAQTKGM